MNKLAAAIFASCLAIGTTAFAQDAATKMDAKKSMSMEDCKAHAHAATGQKATDPANADTDAKCAAMMKHKGSKMKKDPMKQDGAAPMDAPASGAMK